VEALRPLLPLGRLLFREQVKSGCKPSVSISFSSALIFELAPTPWVAVLDPKLLGTAGLKAGM